MASRCCSLLLRSACAGFLLTLSFVFLLTAALPALAMDNSHLRAAQQTNMVNLNRLPLVFEANEGQTNEHVRFLAHAGNYFLSLSKNEAIFSLLGHSQANHSEVPRKATSVHMRIEGASPATRIMAESKLNGKVNYLWGADRSKWLTDIPTYGKVRYAEIYPGIDLVYYGHQGQVEYDFLVAPNTDAKQIHLHFSGMNKLSLDAHGSLLLDSTYGSIALHKPLAYQDVNGVRRKIDCEYKLTKKNTLEFSLGKYDKSRPITIDPILIYSTYLAGSAGNTIESVAVDSAGNAYVTGNSIGCGFPTTPGTLEPNCNGFFPNTVYVAKLNPQGSGLVYATYIGPNNGLGNTGQAIAVDSGGDAYIAGEAYAGMPVSQGAYQTQPKGSRDAGYIAKLSPAGDQLIYGTYLGGSSGDSINAIALDSTGNAYLAGTTYSTDFPTTSGAFETVDTAPDQSNAFVSKLSPDGTELVYSTYLAGTGAQNNLAIPFGEANGIAVDSAGNAYVVGGTTDMAFPVTTGSFQPTYSTGMSSQLSDFRSTGYVTKLDPTGAKLVYSSYLGGIYEAEAQAVAVDSAGDAFVTGWTAGGDITTPGSFQPFSAASNAIVVKINPAGSAFVYSTYLGGSCEQVVTTTGFIGQDSGAGDAGTGIAVDASGNAYVSGLACSKDFPVTTNAVQTTAVNTQLGVSEAFLTVFNPSGSSLLYSTYMGGTGYYGDQATSIALGPSNNVYMAGNTYSTDFPTTPGAFQSPNFVSDDVSTNPQGFVSSFSIPPNGTLLNRNFTLSLSPASATVTAGQIATTTLTISPQNGFSQPIQLSCSGLSDGTYCNFSSQSGAPITSPTSITVQVQTSPQSSKLGNHPFPWLSVSALASIFIWFGIGRRFRKSLFVCLLGTALGMSMLGGCGGSGSGGGGGGGGSQGNIITANILAQGLSVENSISFTITVK